MQNWLLYVIATLLIAEKASAQNNSDQRMKMLKDMSFKAPLSKNGIHYELLTDPMTGWYFEDLVSLDKVKNNVVLLEDKPYERGLLTNLNVRQKSKTNRFSLGM